MPTYALLGATGSTGSAVLRCLLSESPEGVKLNVLVRSKTKLLKAFPKLEQTAALRTRIVESTSTDPAALETCLEDADVVFMCVGSNDSNHGTTLSYDTATAIIATLHHLRKVRGITYKTPTIVQLRTASLNPALARQAPWLVRQIVSFCLHYNYADMKRACTLYETAAKENVLDYIFVDPPTIHDADGTERTGYNLITTETQETALSYADLGAAMCEIAVRGKEFRNQPVGVTATGRVKKTWGVLAGYLVGGAKNRIVGLIAGIFY
jgi:putative NADH-flavin reductase